MIPTLYTLTLICRFNGNRELARLMLMEICQTQSCNARRASNDDKKKRGEVIKIGQKWTINPPSSRIFASLHFIAYS